MTKKQYRPWAPDQTYLIPPSPRDWLPEGHLAYFILEVVDELDLSAIEDAVQAKDPRGQQPYHPQMMVAVLLYSYATGTFSSRRIARATYEDVATRFIAGGQHPFFTRIAAFRRDHLAALGQLFGQAVRLCARAGLVKLGHVSLDGTKIKASASKHRAMSYDRMKKDEQRLQAEIEELLKRAEAADASEDAELGAENDGTDIPEELRRRESRLALIRKAKSELEEEARKGRAEALREQAERLEAKAATHPDARQKKTAATLAAKRKVDAEALDPHSDEDPPEDGDHGGPTLPLHRPPAEPSGEPKEKAQRNFTDPDSRIMVDGEGAFVQAYNAQAAVEEGSQVIVATGVSNQPPDNEYLQPVVAEIEQTAGALPEALTADAGYWSPGNAAWCEERGIDAYISVSRQRHGPAPPEVADALEPDEPEDPTPKEKMAAKLESKKGREMYKKRKTTPEPVFGQIKEARRFRRFSFRGLVAVRHEWNIVCATHNLLKLFRACPGGRLALTPAG
ncbi:MAG: IS1182 family transposase [Gemmatimonadetes bacterium]|nr:MAG: IS1182 family transposase [Gemmatimonadota bacterium]